MALCGNQDEGELVCCRMSVDLTRQGLWSNAFRALDVGMSGIGSPGWAVGCRVREEERVGGVSRTCEPISDRVVQWIGCCKQLTLQATRTLGEPETATSR